MDMVSIGKFISTLRKGRNLTQEQLGEKLGVTGKTVSRWETGTYLPPVEMLSAMSELFSVSINEIVSGKRLDSSEFREEAEKNLRQSLASDTFTLDEKRKFYKKKWIKEHIAVFVIFSVVELGLITWGAILGNRISFMLFILASIIGLFFHMWRNNTMMRYVEKHIYDEAVRYARNIR